jgi:hypothetical protein
MKKIIAAAVATAFVAPAFAADITITGEMEYQYVQTSGAADSMTNDDNQINVVISEELPNGWTISGQQTIANDSTDNASHDGGKLSLSNAEFGTISIGDNDAALDSMNEYATGAPEEGGDVAKGVDASILYSFPTIMPGLSINVSHNPATGLTSTDGKGDGYAVTYTSGAVSVFAGSGSAGAIDYNGAGIKYSSGGITVAYEISEETNATTATSDDEGTGLFASYRMGDLEFGIETQKDETVTNAGAKTVNVDQTISYVQYHWGSNVDVYVENMSSDVAATADEVTVGLEYTF